MPETAAHVREVLENYLKALTTGDKELLLSMFAEDARWADPAGTPEFKGHQGIGQFWDYAHKDPERQLRPKLKEIRACGNEGILRFTMQVRVPQRNQGLDLSIIDYMVINEAGKIQSARAFWDQSTVSVPSGMQPF